MRMAKPSKMGHRHKKSSSNSSSNSNSNSTSKPVRLGSIVVLIGLSLVFALQVLTSTRKLPTMIDTSLYYAAGSNQIHTTAGVDKTYIDNDIQEVEADKGHLWCPVPLMRAGAETLSTSNVWHNLYDEILNASYHAHPRIETLNTTQLHAYKDWVEQLYSFYTPSKLRRSIMNPAPPKEIVQLMKLASEIKHHNAKVSDENDKRVLRILLLGGSVTVGIGCSWPENLNIPKPSHWANPGEECAWSFRLEKLLNHVLFDGEKIVRVDNIATGGQTNEMGTHVLEYRLFPNPDQMPDVVISAFSANEVQEPDLQTVLHNNMQGFVKAAQGLRPCNDQAPLVMMVDDFYGGMVFRAMEQTANVFKLSSWNNFMAVDYASTIKFKVLAEVEKDFNGTSPIVPLLNGNYQLHMGSGMHMGLAWTVMFNIVNSIINVCNDATIGIENHPIAEDALLDTVSVKHHSQEDSHNKNAISYQMIDPHLLPSLEKGEPPFQHIGRMQANVRGSAHEEREILEANIRANKDFCDDFDTNGKDNIQRCSYAWYINHMIGFSSAGQVDKKMKEDLIQKDGWKAEGYPIRQPRAGWYTHTPDSTFSLMIKDTELDTNFVLIVAMKSYSQKWVGSKLAVSISVVKKTDNLNNSSLTDVRAVDWDADSTFLIDGYHDIKTSVHFPHKIPVLGGAKAGDTLILHAKLVSGQEFKIAGIAFCRF